MSSKHCVEVAINSPLKNLSEKNVTESLRLPSDCLAVRSDRLVFCVSLSLSVFPESLKSTSWSLVDWKRLELGAPLALLPLLLFPVYSEFLKTVNYLEAETWAAPIWSPTYSMATELSFSKIPFISGLWALVIDWVSVGEKMILVSLRHRKVFHD